MPPKGDEVAKDLAVAALRRWRSEGADPCNKAHIEAYMVLRQSTSRPRFEQFWSVVGNQENVMETGARLTSDFIITSKSNFPGKLPQWLKEDLVSEEELRRDYDIREDVDLGSVYVCDPSADRSRLGKRTKVVAFFQKYARKSKVKAKDVMAERLDGEGTGNIGARVQNEGSRSASTTEPQADSGSHGQKEAPREQASAKRARLLRAMDSDEKEHAEEDTLETLIEKMKLARDAGNFVGSAGSVHFWSNQVGIEHTCDCCKCSCVHAQSFFIVKKRRSCCS
jgi:hypothetical protein